MATQARSQDEPYVEMPVADWAVGSGARLPPGHAFPARAAPVLLAPDWPLAGYYVYLDWDPSQAHVKFDPKPLWTDENGYLHTTDGGTPYPRPIQRLRMLPFVWWNMDSYGTVFIYDRDPRKLEDKKRRIVQQVKSKKYKDIPRENRLDLTGAGAFRAPAPAGWLAERMKFQSKCEERLSAVRRAEDALQRAIQGSDEHEVAERQKELEEGEAKSFSDADENWILFHWGSAIDEWVSNHASNPKLNALGWRRRYTGFKNRQKRLADSLGRAQADLYKLLCDPSTLRYLAEIGLVLERRADGSNFLWSQRFLGEAIDLLATSPYGASVFGHSLKPLIDYSGEPYGTFRSLCECETCSSLKKLGEGRDGEKSKDNGHSTPEQHQPVGEGPKLAKEAWLWKGAHLSSEAAYRLFTAMEKYPSAVAEALRASTSAASGAAFTAGGLAKKMIGIYNRVHPAPDPDAVKDLEWLFKTGTQKGVDLGWKAEYLKAYGGETAHSIKHMAEKIASFAVIVTATMTVIDVLADKHSGTKQRLELAHALLEAGHGSAELGKGTLAKMIGKGGVPIGTEGAKRIVGAVKLGGGVVGFVISTRKVGHAPAGRGFWKCVTLVGDGVFVLGAALDVTGIGAAAGVTLNILGGLTSVTGKIGGWVSGSSEEPEEKLLIGMHYLVP